MITCFSLFGRQQPPAFLDCYSAAANAGCAIQTDPGTMTSPRIRARPPPAYFRNSAWYRRDETAGNCFLHDIGPGFVLEYRYFGASARHSPAPAPYNSYSGSA
jgi:hypothetical protein